MFKTGPVLVLLRIHPLIRLPFSFRGIVYSVVLLLYRECRSIVLLRLASSPHRNTVWIISGLLTIARISVRILALGFTVAVHWSESLQQKGE